MTRAAIAAGEDPKEKAPAPINKKPIAILMAMCEP